MVTKQADNHDADILELRRLLTEDITAKQRFLIEREIKCIGSGARGEETSAYYIDFRYKNNSNWAVIHDLRLELDGFAAQIDHLLINRFLEIYVLESKNYYYGIKITSEGDFMAWNGKAYVGIESPIEQNRRHITLLEKLVTKSGILPTRLGIPLPASFHNYVVVAPTSRIDRAAGFDSKMVVKADALVETISKRIDGMGIVETLASAAKMVSSETVQAFAQSLVEMHRPAKINYAAKFGLTTSSIPASETKPAEQISQPAEQPSKKHICSGCGTEVDSKVVNFCRFNKRKFDGKTLCQSCQKKFVEPTATDAGTVQEPAADFGGHTATGTPAACETCGSAVDKKVVYFCRINSKRFSGKILCRSCQQKGL